MSQYTTPKDPSTAFLIEFVGGFFGLLGLGYFYTGRNEEGIVRLLVWFVIIAGGWVLVLILTAFIIGLCLIPVMLALQIGVPYWSANSLKQSMITETGPPMV